MNEHQRVTAKNCLSAAETGEMAFPEIVETLMRAGFESYAVDFRCATATYYLPDGEGVVLPTEMTDGPVAPNFDTAIIKEAIREAQRLVPGYTYRSFCRKVVAAGCAGYIVSFSGRRALYFGRTAETHAEHFPQ